MVNVGNLCIAYAFGAPNTAKSVGEHFSGGMLMAAVATVYTLFTSIVQMADMGEILESSVHGVTSFSLMGYLGNTYMITWGIEIVKSYFYLLNR
jgi:hypothetical protein